VGAEVIVRLPDGSTKQLPAGSTALDLARSIGKRLAKDAVAAAVDGAEVDLTCVLGEETEVAILTGGSDAGRTILRHSTAHVLAQAVLDLWPGAHYAIGPAIEDGFYYDFALPHGATFSDEDISRIEARMREIIAEDQPFVREEHTIAEGLALFAEQPFKREIIEGVGSEADLAAEAAQDMVPGESVVSVYRTRPRASWITTAVSSICVAALMCLRRAGSVTSGSCGWPARIGAETSIVRSSSGSTARLGTLRRHLSITCTGSRRPRDVTTGA